MNPTISIYDSKTIWNRRGKPAVVQISRYGHIRFSVEAVKLLGLVQGERITFRTHSNDIGILYFYRQATGLPLRDGLKCKTGVRLEVYCRPLALKLLAFFDFKTSKTFRISSEQLQYGNTKFWFILKENIHKPIKWKN